MYGKTEQGGGKPARTMYSTELGRQLEIVVGSVANAAGIAQYCAEKLQLADMLRSDLAN